jgi:hypothetical protein
MRHLFHQWIEVVIGGGHISDSKIRFLPQDLKGKFGQASDDIEFNAKFLKATRSLWRHSVRQNSEAANLV